MGNGVHSGDIRERLYNTQIFGMLCPSPQDWWRGRARCSNLLKPDRRYFENICSQ